MRILVPENRPEVVVVMSAVLVDVESSTELMGRMNEINTSYGPPHVVLVDRTIWVQGSRPSEGLDPEDLSC